MKKAVNVLYWVFMVWLSFSYLFAAYTELTRWQQGIDLMIHLGYPIYLLTILGVAKFLAVVGIWQKFSPTLREWAFAGITINLVGAIVSHITVGDGFGGSFPALLNLIIAAVAYWALKKREAMKAVPQTM